MAGRKVKWIKLHIDPWLWGSTRTELTPAERAVWIDLLALAGVNNDNGIILADEASLPRRLMVPKALFDRTIKRCIEVEKLSRNKDGQLVVVNYNRYQVSDYEVWYWERGGKEKRREDRHKDQSKTKQALAMPSSSEARNATRGEESRVDKEESRIEAELPSSPFTLREQKQGHKAVKEYCNCYQESPQFLNAGQCIELIGNWETFGEEVMLKAYKWALGKGISFGDVNAPIKAAEKMVAEGKAQDSYSPRDPEAEAQLAVECLNQQGPCSLTATDKPPHPYCDFCPKWSE